MPAKTQLNLSHEVYLAMLYSYINSIMDILSSELSQGFQFKARC